MKKMLIILISLVIMLSGCSNGPSNVIMESSSDEAIKLTFDAVFYDNYGEPWLQATGNKFDIIPNKVKEYAYSSDGKWVSKWELSSVVSVSIDGRSIETCGSTVLFADSRLEKFDIDIPEEIDVSEYMKENSISSPGRWSNYWTLQWMWKTKDLHNKNNNSRIVIIQSQLGNPICMFIGDNVYWEVCTDLPKTTKIVIDNKEVYIHRANFAIIDSELFE